jgi:hypothetical protein
MVAIVGDSANSGSIALHRRFGFELVGTLRSVGFKHGCWVDTPILQRGLGTPGDKQSYLFPPPPGCTTPTIGPIGSGSSSRLISGA